MPSEDFQFGQGFVGPQRLAISAIFQAFIVMLDGADEITSGAQCVHASSHKTHSRKNSRRHEVIKPSRQSFKAHLPWKLVLWNPFKSCGPKLHFLILISWHWQGLLFCLWSRLQSWTDSLSGGIFLLFSLCRTVSSSDPSNPLPWPETRDCPWERWDPPPPVGAAKRISDVGFSKLSFKISSLHSLHSSPPTWIRQEFWLYTVSMHRLIYTNLH